MSSPLPEHMVREIGDLALGVLDITEVALDQRDVAIVEASL